MNLRAALTGALLALVLGSLVPVAGCGERTDGEVYQELLTVVADATNAPAPMAEADAVAAERACREHLQRLANSTLEVGGEQVRVLAARATFQLGGIFLHRHRDPTRAKALMFAAKDVLAVVGTPSAKAQAEVLERKLKTLDGRFEGDHLDRAGGGGGDGTGTGTAVGGAQN